MAHIKISWVIQISYPKFELNKRYDLSIMQETFRTREGHINFMHIKLWRKRNFEKVEGQKHIFRVEMGHTEQGRLNGHKFMLLSLP